MIGKMLGNRYEILEKIGTGGMSVVYKAKCHLLNRFVAVKVLRQEFIDNADFIKRFKVESQAAASLSHPNIVSIYDVGNEDDIYYIVMEYVDGITLKDYIVKRSILDWREAVGIAIQICSALEAAHKNSIIHRDIKPHNIMITSDGVAKVMDFGIARAATYFTVTFAGNAIGSVHYFSPEQARGGYTDNRTDIYSLGVVMYEMLTGKLPFDGDSPVSIAFKHLQDEIVSPRELNSFIPKALNDIVLKAMSKELDARYQSATSMLYDLNEALKNPNGDFVGIEEELDSVDSPTIIIPSVSTAKNRVDNTDAKMKAKTKGKKDKLAVYSAIISSILLLGLLGFIGYKLGVQYMPASSDAIVPNLVGKTEDDAQNALTKLNLSMKVKDRRADDTVAPGVIIEQSPSAGITVKMPNEVEVVISLGKKDIVIPYVEKKDYREAKIELEQVGLVPKLSYEASDTIPINFITRTNPPVGSTVKQGTEVELFISNGPGINSFLMPNLIGKTENQAKKILLENKLVYGQVNYQDNPAPYGTIVAQSVAPNDAVTEGSSINLTLSTGSNNQTTSKNKNIKITLPQDNPTVNVKVVMIDNNAQKTTVYQQTLSRTVSPISVPVSGVGKYHIQVYFNGVLSAEQDIIF